jgi:hypothetical protein
MGRYAPFGLVSATSREESSSWRARSGRLPLMMSFSSAMMPILHRSDCAKLLSMLPPQPDGPLAEPLSLLRSSVTMTWSSSRIC